MNANRTSEQRERQNEIRRWSRRADGYEIRRRSWDRSGGQYVEDLDAVRSTVANIDPYSALTGRERVGPIFADLCGLWGAWDDTDRWGEERDEETAERYRGQQAWIIREAVREAIERAGSDTDDDDDE